MIGVGLKCPLRGKSSDQSDDIGFGIAPYFSKELAHVIELYPIAPATPLSQISPVCPYHLQSASQCVGVKKTETHAVLKVFG